jgi:hypothetical protein
MIKGAENQSSLLSTMMYNLWKCWSHICFIITVLSETGITKVDGGKQEKAEVGLANMAKSLLLLKLDYPAWI